MGFDCTPTNKLQSCTTAVDCNNLNWKQEKAANCIEEPVIPFVGVLDLYGLSDGARSVAQRLTVNYTGPLIRVRETGGGTEADIPYDLIGDLDQVALLAHCGANDGHVVKIYDQVGAKDAIQSTTSRQGRIVIAGVVNLDNGQPSVEMDKTAFQCWEYTDSFASGGDLTVYLVLNPLDTNFNGFWGEVASPSLMIWNGGGGGGLNSRFNDGGDKDCASTALTTQKIVTALVVSGDNSYFYGNSSLLDSIAFGTMAAVSSRFIGVGTMDAGGGIGWQMDGQFQEEILYKTDQTSNRAAFEANRIAYYNIP